MTQIERRRHGRVEIVTKVRYVTQDTIQYHYSRDLSLGGMFLETREPFPVGTELELDFALPGRTKKFKARGQVVRTIKPEPDQHDLVGGMGVSFYESPEELKKEMEAFLKEENNKRGEKA